MTLWKKGSNQVKQKYTNYRYPLGPKTLNENLEWNYKYIVTTVSRVVYPYTR